MCPSGESLAELMSLFQWLIWVILAGRRLGKWKLNISSAIEEVAEAGKNDQISGQTRLSAVL